MYIHVYSIFCTYENISEYIFIWMFLLPDIGPKDPVNALKLLLLPVYSINIYNNLFPNFNLNRAFVAWMF